MKRREFAFTCAAGLAVSAAPIWAKPRARTGRIRIGAQTNPFGVPIKPYDHLLRFSISLHDSIMHLSRPASAVCSH